MVKLAIRDVKVRSRLREDLGNLDGLAASISRHGLIHPIVVDDSDVLIAGQRRLEACKKLGVETIEARRFGELTPAERRLIEIEENQHRKGLTELERSKVTKDIWEQATAVLEEEVSTAPVETNRNGGRPTKGMVSKERIAERSGIPEQTARDAEEHVAVADRYPLLQGPDWSRRAAVKVGKLLDELPAQDRKRVVALCEREGAHAAAAEPMVAQWSGASPETRERIWEMANAKDERERSLAVTTLAKIAPEIDPRVTDAVEAAKCWRRAAGKFKDDAENERLLKEAEHADSIAQRLRELHAAKVKKLERELAL